MARAGELSHKIAFDKREVISPDFPDDLGNTESAFVEQFVVSAKVLAKFGGETVTAARLSGKQPVNITVRLSSKTERVAPDWRARDTRSGRIFELRSITDPDDSGAWLEMLAEDLGERFVADPADNPVALRASISAAMVFAGNLLQINKIGGAISGTISVAGAVSSFATISIGSAISGSLAFGANVLQAQQFGSSITASPAFAAGLRQAHQFSAAISGNAAFSVLIVSVSGVPVGAQIAATAAFAASLRQTHAMGAAIAGSPTFVGDVASLAAAWDYSTEYLLQF